MPEADGRVVCIDYSVGGRYLERRLNGHSNGSATAPHAYQGRLVALRWPVEVLVFDDGEDYPVTCTTPC